MPREVRVAYALNQPDAVAEACRRLRVMHEKWPDTPWRMRVRRERGRLNPRWHVWRVYAIVPAERVAEPCS